MVEREVFYATTYHTLQVPDVEGHTNHLVEAKSINYSEKFGPSVGYLTQMSDVIKGTGTAQGYVHYTFPDGSTITAKWKGELTGGGPAISGAARAKGTWSYIKGTGKYEGIQGQGTWKSYVLAKGQWYSEREGGYTLP